MMVIIIIIIMIIIIVIFEKNSSETFFANFAGPKLCIINISIAIMSV